MIAITGGGTGGHLAIAKALTQELHKRQIPCIYIGSLMGQDKMWFEHSDLFSAVYFLDSTGVVNKRGLAKLAALKLSSPVIGERLGISERTAEAHMSSAFKKLGLHASGELAELLEIAEI